MGETPVPLASRSAGVLGSSFPIKSTARHPFTEFPDPRFFDIQFIAGGPAPYSYFGDTTLVCQVFRKRERDDTAAGRTTRFRSPGGDHHKLTAVDHISAGAGI